MPATHHDPEKFISGLGAKLATRSRHVCAFLGAGVARACGLPDIAGLQVAVLSQLEPNERNAFSRQLEKGNLEKALSRLRRIAALISGQEKVDELTAAQALTLDESVCKAIVTALDTGAADLEPVYLLAAWTARADYQNAVEIFTVNYDLLLEMALERFGVPYFDGFVGNLEAKFRTELVEAAPESVNIVPSFFVRLWKLHGSVNWKRRDNNIIRMGQAVEGTAAAIYPSDEKYEESRRVPFIVLQDRLRRALHQPETLMVITGYSFGDAHLNEFFFDAAMRCPRSEFIVFCHSGIPASLEERALASPNLQVVSKTEAILGGVKLPWHEPREPLNEDLWAEGEFALSDFGNLAKYLARSSTREYESDRVLREVLAELQKPGHSEEVSPDESS